jgi:mannose-1-phosphate guanylyltransferase
MSPRTTAEESSLMSATVRPLGPRSNLWAIVLAGGEGVRLKPLVKQVCGDERPKQYVPLFGPRTLLGQTLDRVGRLVSAERTVIVSVASHWHYLAPEAAGRPAIHVLVQPVHRGTAAGVLYPAHWIDRVDPDAVVAIFPADHFVLEEDAFMHHVEQVAAAVRARPELIVLLGARATSPETEYGWIEPGEPLARAGSAIELRRVAAFHEKPSPADAERYLDARYLWNTFVLVASLRSLLEAGRALVPDMHARLARMGSFAGTEHEDFAVRQAFALMRPANFSRAVLERRPPGLAVSELPAILWSDLGTPRRVLELAPLVRPTPAWVTACAAVPA